MNTGCQCSCEKTLRAMKNSAGVIIPGALLALLPKCPLCLSAWMSVALGLGVPASTANALHGTLIVLCLAVIAFHLTRHLTRKSTTTTTHL